MDEKLLTALIGGGAGLATGTIGGLISPWVHWHIEQRKQRRYARRELISAVRNLLQYCLGVTTAIPVSDIFSNSSYYQIREYLNPDHTAQLETLWDFEARDAPVTSLMHRLLSDLVHLEKEWKLI
jgi:hypothetical protein